MKRKFRTLDEIEEEFFRKNPRRIDGYIQVLFDEIDEKGGQGALLSALRMLSRVIGVSEVARKADMTRKGLQKALSEKGNPQLSTINAILHAMGYRLSVQKIAKKSKR